MIVGFGSIINILVRHWSLCSWTSPLNEKSSSTSAGAPCLSVRQSSHKPDNTFPANRLLVTSRSSIHRSLQSCLCFHLARRTIFLMRNHTLERSISIYYLIEQHPTIYLINSLWSAHISKVIKEFKYSSKSFWHCNDKFELSIMYVKASTLKILRCKFSSFSSRENN